MDLVKNVVHTVSRSTKYSKDSINYSSVKSGLTLRSRSTLALSSSVDADRSDTDSNLSVKVTNTLSMISTPWNTESCWSSLSETLLFSKDLLENSPYFPWPKTDTLTSLSADPLSTSYSSGVPTPSVGTYSKTTVTLYSFAATPCLSDQLHLPSAQQSWSSSDTLSSWTPESINSVELFSSNSSVVRVHYPWSPPSRNSCTDYYPNSMNTCSLDLVAKKESKDTIRPVTSLTRDMMSPTSLHSTKDYRAFDKDIAYQNGFPMFCTVI